MTHFRRGERTRWRRTMHFVHPAPRLGLSIIDPSARRQLARLLAEVSPSVVLVSHSYLAPLIPSTSVPVVVDFQNIEVERLLSMASRGPAVNRATAWWESVKARRWEPRVAASCALTLTTTEREADWVRRWSDAVVVVPNAIDAPREWSASRAEGPVVYVANAGYRPNREAGERLVRHVWPAVRARRPEARLHLVGAGMREQLGWAGELPGISVIGEVDDLSPHYASASVVAGPVTEGGGTQLKILHGLAHGRSLVASPFSMRSVPPRAREACIEASDPDGFAAGLAQLLGDVADRHRRERLLMTPPRPVPDWEQACAPLMERLSALRAGWLP